MRAIFGCGGLYKQIVSLGLDELLRPQYLIDSNPEKIGTKFMDKYIISAPDVLRECQKDDSVCIMSGEHEAEILHTIKEINTDVRIVSYGQVVSWVEACLTGNAEDIEQYSPGIDVLQQLTWKMRGDRVSYSQNAEDLVFEHMCPESKGLYVDIGAHHPMLYSNTYRLFLKGWNGINIDPLPDCKELFDLYRPNDINLNVGIGNPRGGNNRLPYYCFERPTFNTMSENRLKEIQREGWTKLKEIREIPIVTLTSIFEQYAENSVIDLLTIDVESMEIEVLSTNDWDKYRPRFIILEVLGSYGASLRDVMDFKLVKYMNDVGYCPINKVAHSVFFRDDLR